MELSSSLSLLNQGSSIVLEKRMKLLYYIQEYGSILQAAKLVPLSYKAAWEAISAMNNLCASEVVSKTTGGKGGGGASLTEYGKNLLKTYELLKTEHERFTKHLSSMVDFNSGTLKSIGFMSLELSARNQLHAIIEDIDLSLVQARIKLRFKSGESVNSLITKQALKNLDLKKGSQVFAVFKASCVILCDKFTSDHNQLACFVEKITHGKEKSEVILDLHGDKIVSILSNETLKFLSLKKGAKVYSQINENDILIGK